MKIAREKERKTHRREGSRGEDDEGKRRKRRIAIGAKGNDESYDLDDEEEVNIVIERNDELEERRRREKNRVVKRWATLAEMVVRNAREEGKKEESASQRIERLVQMAYAYRCKDKVERNSRLRGCGAKPGVRFSLSEGGLLEQNGRITRFYTILLNDRRWARRVKCGCRGIRPRSGWEAQRMCFRAWNLID